MSEADDEERAGADVRPPGAARRGPAWVILAVVAAALLVCCCSAVVGLAVSWSAGLFHDG
ncbi:hypothetical protein AB0H57_03925 [Micromonospora sp. NPDC050686]|uniref:hypothetical protein n=1 Tax=Micromonospora sp. NPDC050686 TaxID=3154631 RepID=UPI0033C6AAF5